MSTTRMAMSQREEPRERKLLKDSWPGVSMMSKPGNFNLLMSNWEEVKRRIRVKSEKQNLKKTWVTVPHLDLQPQHPSDQLLVNNNHPVKRKAFFMYLSGQTCASGISDGGTTHSSGENPLLDSVHTASMLSRDQ